jgi:type I restriction enzyme R subunit
MHLSEADTRAKLIDPTIHARGWTEDLIRREETAGTVDVVDGIPRRRAKGREVAEALATLRDMRHH